MGDQLVSSQGLLVPIESISNLNEITTVYNLRVADHHTYFVGGALWGWDVWVHNAYNSTFSQRVTQTPAGQFGDAAQFARGHWTGARGRSTFIPADIAENADVIAMLNAKGLTGIAYRNGIPNFSAFVEGTVNTSRMTTKRTFNFALADELLAKQARWKGVDVELYRNKNDLTWHELNNMRKMQLIPSRINSFFGHLGGVGKLKL